MVDYLINKKRGMQMRRIVSKILLLVLVLIGFSGCSKKPGDVIKDFYSAENWEEKKKYILDSEGIKPEQIYNELAEYKVLDVSEEKKISVDSTMYKAKIKRSKDGKETTQLKYFLVINSSNEEKIDFHAKLKTNKIDLRDLSKGVVKLPVKMWVELYSVLSVYGFKEMYISENYGDMDCLVDFIENHQDEYMKVYEEVSKNRYSYYLITIEKVELKRDWMGFPKLVVYVSSFKKDIFDGLEDELE